MNTAGSEGESAFTRDFVRKVDQATLMARRLEAGLFAVCFFFFLILW